MTVGELRRILVDLSIPDNATLYFVTQSGKKVAIQRWFIEKSHSNTEYELSLVSLAPETPKEIKPPPFKSY